MQPTQIGRYEVVRVLGQGAMGVVYEAIDPRLARRVAIKTIRVENLDSQQASAYESRFDTEARAVARLTHPNIVSVYDSGQMEGLSFLVMEFVPGVNLKQCLRAGVRFTPRGAVAVFQGVLAALSQAHAQRIIHRDIKPENVLIDAHGVVKLTDFGIAKMLDAEVDNGTQLSGGTIGTPRYMSPEQVRGAPLDARSDVFSAGVLLYELLTGTWPFDGGSAIAIATAILHDEPLAPSSLNPEVPPALDAVLAQALSKSVHGRLESAQAFASAMAAVAWPVTWESTSGDAAEEPKPAAELPPGLAALLTPDSRPRLAHLFGEAGLDVSGQSPSTGLSVGVGKPLGGSTQGVRLESRTEPPEGGPPATTPLEGTRYHPPLQAATSGPTNPAVREGSAPVVEATAAVATAPPKLVQPAPVQAVPTGADASSPKGGSRKWPVVLALGCLLAGGVWWLTRPSAPVPAAEPVVAAPAPAAEAPGAPDVAHSLADNEKLVAGPGTPAGGTTATGTDAGKTSVATTPAKPGDVKPVDPKATAKAKPASGGAEKAVPAAEAPPPVAATPAQPSHSAAPQPAASPAHASARGTVEPCTGMGFFEREACLWKQCSTDVFRAHPACERFQPKNRANP